MLPNQQYSGTVILLRALFSCSYKINECIRLQTYYCDIKHLQTKGEINSLQWSAIANIDNTASELY